MKRLGIIALVVFVSVVCSGQTKTRMDATRVKNLPWTPTIVWNSVPPVGSYFLDLYWTGSDTLQIPANCSTWLVKARNAASGSSTITVSKNGSPVCTFTFAIGSTTATAGTGGSTVNLSNNDHLTITGGGDATLSGITLNLDGKRI